MGKYITVVLKYPDGATQPSFSPDMTALGGEVIAVQFSDALAEMEEMESRIQGLQEQVECCPAVDIVFNKGEEA